MTKQQQTDLQTWKQNPDQPLPASLKNALIERCLEALEYQIKSYPLGFGSKLDDVLMVLQNPKLFNEGEEVWAIQTLLSRTPDNQAVMPFLDVETEFEKFQNDHGGIEYTTLDHLLYQQFTETLRTGKTLDEALSIINLIYLQNV